MLGDDYHSPRARFVVIQAALEGLKAMQLQPGVVPKRLVLPEMSVAGASDGTRTSGSVVPYEDRMERIEARDKAKSVEASQGGTLDSPRLQQGVRERTKSHGRAEMVRSTTEGMLEGNLQDLDMQVRAVGIKKHLIAAIANCADSPSLLQL
jgi:hypothetical protein